MSCEALPLQRTRVLRSPLPDKTQVFHDQIEVKQKELQPWNAKIDAKKAEIDVATGERDALRKKAEGVKASREQAESDLQKLREDLEAKTTELDKLKHEKAKNQNAIKEAERELQVGIVISIVYRSSLHYPRTLKATFKASAPRLPLHARRPRRRSLRRNKAAATTESWIACSGSRLRAVSMGST